MDIEPWPRSPSLACARKLVHWINSLPLASCLLVDALDELRLGDVLDAIVAWLQNCDHQSQDDPIARAGVTRAVAFAAQRCSAADSDVMCIVHSAQCVARIVDGDVTAIAAVVSVLRRVAMEKGEADHAQVAVQDRATRLCVGRAIQAQTSVEAKDVTTRQREQTTRARDTALRPRRSVATSARIQSLSPASNISVGTTPSSNPATAFADIPQNENDQRNSGDKTPRRHSKRRPSGVQATKLITPQAKDVLLWMESLGVIGGSTDHPNALYDGVVLCRLAAAVARRRGSIAVRHKLVTCPTTSHQQSRGELFPRGATVQPRAQAERHHNLRIAWELLKECHVVPVSAMDLTPDALVEVMEGKAEDGTVWHILAHVQRQMQQPSRIRKLKTTALACVVDDTVKRRRPYITAEQIDDVKRWMKTEGVDPTAVSAGIFDDSLRNGVSLCQLLSKRSIRCGRPTFKDPPKTLLEVRANLHAAISIIASLGGSLVPTVYLTKQAVDGIAMGDKQFIYGLLWHWMQVCKDKDARASQPINTVKVSEKTRPAEALPPRPLTEPPPVQTEPVRLTRPVVKPKVTSLLLDVPACQLVEEEYRKRNEKLSDVVGCRSVPWEATSLIDGFDDIVPMTSRTRPIHRTEKEERHDDIVPLRREALLNPTMEIEGDLTAHYERRSGNAVGTTSDSDLVPRRDLTGAIGERISPEVDDGASDPTPQSPHKEDAVPVEVVHTPLLTVQEETNEFSQAQVNQIIHWLGQLGIQLTDVKAFTDPTARLRDFSSGVLLCTIVEKLEHMRSMEGVCRPDKTHGIARANALHNIDKAFDILRRKKILPLGLLRQKLKIYEGDRVTIFRLLFHIRKAYRHSFAQPHQPKRSQAALKVQPEART